MTRLPLVAGNWKMHKTLAEARELVGAIRADVERLHGVETLICPPYQLLFPMAKAVAGSAIMLGAQDAHEAPQGAYTGEISVPMLKDTGCTHVIIGHSERRQYFGERGPTLAKKVRAVLGSGLHVIFCVGETLEQREANQTEAIVENQLLDVLGRSVLPRLHFEIPSPKGQKDRSGSSEGPSTPPLRSGGGLEQVLGTLDPKRLIVAYEPVWAIGTGLNAAPEQAKQVHAFIRSKLAAVFDVAIADRIRILYGGSVKPDNAANLAAQPDIDGMLVGGASLVAADFVAIISAVVKMAHARPSSR